MDTLPRKHPNHGCFLLLLLLFSLPPLSLSLSDTQVSFISHRQLLALTEFDGSDFEVDLDEAFANDRLKRAYFALQKWKKAIYSDPFNTTGNWLGADVCAYNGVFCAPALDDPKLEVVAGVDLNHADIAGYLAPELGFLTELALFHVNSNRFCGVIPKSFSKLSLMHEFDVSNNRFAGKFPDVVLSWPDVKFLDVRFNDFEGELPPELFEKDLDALFLNNNRFTSTIPETIGNSTVSVVSFANNEFHGCIPRSVGEMRNLNEILLLGNKLGGCFPPEIGNLSAATVLDVSFNGFVGSLPESFSGLASLESLNVAHNKLTGVVSGSVCNLPKLLNFSFSYNFFDREDKECAPAPATAKDFDDVKNCLSDRPEQREAEECLPVVSESVDCSKSCGSGDGFSPAPSPDDPYDQSPVGRRRSPPSSPMSPSPSPANSPPASAPTFETFDDQSESPAAEEPSLPPPISSPSPSPSPTIESPMESPSPTVESPPPVESLEPPPSSPPPPLEFSPPPPVESVEPPPSSPPPPLEFSPPPPVEPLEPPPSSPPPPAPEHGDVILPPTLGHQYSSPPPPIFQGY